MNEEECSEHVEDITTTLMEMYNARVRKGAGQEWLAAALPAMIAITRLCVHEEVDLADLLSQAVKVSDGILCSLSREALGE